jgi:hypothetical protein
MKIYVASSWRNLAQPGIVHMLRRCGHEVYDFRNPGPGDHGFTWSEIDPNWKQWTPEQYAAALQHPIAKRGYETDMRALRECDACVLVLPSGRSASWEFGFAMGQGKRGAVVMLEPCEPELMYRGAEILTSADAIFDAFGEPVVREGRAMGDPLMTGLADAVQGVNDTWRALVKAQEKSLKAMLAREGMSPGSTRARVTTANARWARTAEHRDRCRAEFDKALRELCRAAGVEAGNG